MDHFWLSFHLAYACRHSGACCTTRWPIPIEHDRALTVQAAIDAGRVSGPAEWWRPVPEAPADVAGVLTLQRSGACVFHRVSPARGGADAGGCAIHTMRPVSCEHFPYVCVIDPRGVHVTLSHFCPTAANLLFDVEGPVRVVPGPPIFEGGRLPEGLDARESLPPIDTPQPPSRGAARPRLLSWDEVSRREAAIVTRVAADTLVPEAPSVERYDRARAAVAGGRVWPEAPPDLERGWHAHVAPAWQGLAPVVGRYLASRAHASWAMYLGDGLEAVERMVTVARTTLQVEAVRQCVARGRTLDRPTLTEAIRQADLLLVHLADPERLCAAG